MPGSALGTRELRERHGHKRLPWAAKVPVRVAPERQSTHLHTEVWPSRGCEGIRLVRRQRGPEGHPQGGRGKEGFPVEVALGKD